MGSFVAACSAKVARLPLPGESLLASNFVLEPGGKGFNLIAGTQFLGVAVDGMLAIGDDPFGDFAKAAFARLGLKREMLVAFAGPTGAGIGFIDAGGENCLAVYPGANARLGAPEVKRAAGRISGARLVLAQFEIGDEPIECAFALARQAGGTTLLNPSPYREIPPQILANTSILVVNRVEADCLARQYGFDAADGGALAEILFAEGLRALIITSGAEGARLWEKNVGQSWQPAFPAEVVDTLGAGDAFIAAFAAGFAAGLSLAQCLRWGAAAGGACDDPAWRAGCAAGPGGSG